MSSLWLVVSGYISRCKTSHQLSKGCVSLHMRTKRCRSGRDDCKMWVLPLLHCCHPKHRVQRASKCRLRIRDLCGDGCQDERAHRMGVQGVLYIRNINDWLVRVCRIPLYLGFLYKYVLLNGVNCKLMSKVYIFFTVSHDERRSN